MKAQIYIVQPGDSLSKISQKLFGDFSKVEQLAKMNNIANENLIHPGQQLLVPDVPGAVETNALVMESSSSTIKEQIAKWFPWLFVVAAVLVIGNAARKQNKKNKATATPKVIK